MVQSARGKKDDEVYGSATRAAQERAAGGERTAFRVPDGVNLFSIKKAGTYRIDLLPYRVGKHNPRCDEGMIYYERSIQVHFSVGPNQRGYTCSASTLNKKCPICEYRAANKNASEKEIEEVVNSLKPKNRQLFWMNDLDNPDKGNQLWEIALWNFGKTLDEEVTERDMSDFFRRVGGCYVKARFVESVNQGRKFFECTRVDLIPREEDHPKSLFDELEALDDLILVQPYEKMKAIFLQVNEAEESDDGEEPAAGKKKPIKKRPAAPVEDDDEEPEDEEETPPKKKGAKKTPREEIDDDIDEFLDDEEEEAPPKKKVAGKKRPPVEEEDDEFEDDEPAPQKKKAPVKKKAAPVEDDDDDFTVDDDEEEEEDEPPKKKPAAGKKPVKKKAVSAEDDDEYDDDIPF